VSAAIERRKYDPSDMHQMLYVHTQPQREQDATVWDDGYVSSQALFCPYYEPLTGTLGSDWGVILNPESTKFALLVFEHEWCGCPSTQQESGEWFADHGGGNQRDDEWAIPYSRRRVVRRMERHRKRRLQEAARPSPPEGNEP
jgi:hypothetical protein